MWYFRLRGSRDPQSRKAGGIRDERRYFLGEGCFCGASGNARMSPHGVDLTLATMTTTMHMKTKMRAHVHGGLSSRRLGRKDCGGTGSRLGPYAVKKNMTYAHTSKKRQRYVHFSANDIGFRRRPSMPVTLSRRESSCTFAYAGTSRSSG